jgi:hypothetical protein
MPDKVIYVLGAGFSAPLGIPVMSNFLVKSKDMYFADPNRYGYFEKVLKRIQSMSVTKNYYRADLFNIEEILSISEMASFVQGHAFRDEFISYIKDVIAYYTPQMEGYEPLPSNWEGFVFGKKREWTPYGYFVTNICNVRLIHATSEKGAPVVARRNDDVKATYGVVSLNYDLVLESICSFANEHFRLEAPLTFCRDDSATGGPKLAKLHGTLDVGTIVPPTWSKGSHPEIIPAWRIALEELRTANQIRFIGYSLPAADTYVRYLLKAAAMDAPNLKQIDVVCWDPTGQARAQYDDFITFPNYRFANGKTQDYLGLLLQLTTSHDHRQGRPWRRLEKAHDVFMSDTIAPARPNTR